jgi:mannose-6-phosphate isomerase-like protein (cupin superfamily)
VNIDGLIKEIKQPWQPIEVARVNDQVIRLAMFKGSYPMHKHSEEDELFFVYKGKIIIQIENELEVILEQGDMVVIPKGKKHSPSSDLDSYVLMFEPLSLKSTGD